MFDAKCDATVCRQFSTTNDHIKSRAAPRFRRCLADHLAFRNCARGDKGCLVDLWRRPSDRRILLPFDHSL